MIIFFFIVARLKAIDYHLLLHILRIFMLYQMGIKSTFLNGDIVEKVYVEQLSRFKDHTFSNHIYKLNIIYYGLK